MEARDANAAPPEGNALPRGLAWAWTWLRDAEAVLHPCRVSAVVVLAGALLLFSPQGQEFTIRLPSEGLGKSAWFQAAVLLWALQTWYWARLALDITFGRDRGASLAHARLARIQALIRRIPRAIAVFSYFVAVVASGRAGWTDALIAILVGALFIVFLVYRTTHIAPGVAALKRKFLKLGEAPAREPPEWLSPARELRLRWKFLGATFAGVALFTAWASVDAVGFGWYFGAAAAPFLGFAAIVPVASLLAVLASRGGSPDGPPRGITDRRGYPVITILVIVAVVFSLFPRLDNHGVRTLSAPRHAGRSLDEVLERWYAQAPALPDGRKNFVVVATAGGGLRAAYWTATVLGAIQDNAGDFRRQLAAVSGVSGGSLGATVFVTLLAQRPVCAQAGTGAGAYECAGQAVLTQDFLGPTVAALLFPDLIQRFLPLDLPDRAKALEQSWERAWTEAGFRENPWSDRGFRALWVGEEFLPALLLNGTHVETGRRVITSNLDIARSAAVFRDAYDFYELAPAGKEIRPSTAAHNSARFTYVSPAGTLADRTHLVDGGYFENFGAVAARELLEAAVARFGDRIRPIAILISNDPNLTASDFPQKPPGAPRSVPAQSWAGEVLSPLRALLHTRDARGLLAAAELRAAAERAGGSYFQFRLCKDPGRPAPALGWVLSDDSEGLMRQQLRSDCGNPLEFTALRDALAGREPTAKPH
jgi:hypothetical protein